MTRVGHSSDPVIKGECKKVTLRAQLYFHQPKPFPWRDIPWRDFPIGLWRVMNQCCGIAFKRIDGVHKLGGLFAIRFTEKISVRDLPGLFSQRCWL
jgi:hypothetical protein